MKRKIAMMLVLATAFGTMAGCGNKEASNNEEEFVLTTSDEYPLQTDEELRAWTSSYNGESYSNSQNDLPITQFLEEATGIKVKWEHGTGAESLNLLVASGDMPDMLVGGWQNTYGGPDNCLDTGVLADLTPYIEGGASPNFKKIMDENPEMKRLSTSTDGRYYSYFMLLGDKRLASFIDIFIRKDLLDKAGLGVPETLEEWETALYAFKDMGIEKPVMLKFTNNSMDSMLPFFNCFGIAPGFYHDNGVVKFGPAEEKFRDWVELMAKWYKDGILDTEFVNEEGSRWDAAITAGKNGAYIGGISSYARYKEAIEEGSEIEYVPTKIPVMNKGDKAEYSQAYSMVNNAGIAISGDSKKKELAVRYCDFGYSEEGQKMYNFGKEGVSYTMKDGAPTYADIITDESKREGLTQSQALTKYTNATLPLCSVQNVNYLLQTYKYDLQKTALEYASDTTFADDHKLSDAMLDNEMSKEFADIMTPINTYREETISKIIAGKLPLSELDKYYEELERMNIGRAIEIYQEAYDAFVSKSN